MIHVNRNLVYTDWLLPAIDSNAYRLLPIEDLPPTWLKWSLWSKLMSWASDTLSYLMRVTKGSARSDSTTINHNNNDIIVDSHIYIYIISPVWNHQYWNTNSQRFCVLSHWQNVPGGVGGGASWVVNHATVSKWTCNLQCVISITFNISSDCSTHHVLWLYRQSDVPRLLVSLSRVMRCFFIMFSLLFGVGRWVGVGGGVCQDNVCCYRWVFSHMWTCAK